MINETYTAERLARLETTIDHLRAEQTEQSKDYMMNKKDTEITFGEIRSTFTEIRVQFSEIMGGFERVDTRINNIAHDITTLKADVGSQLNTIKGQLNTVTREIDQFKVKITYIMSTVVVIGSGLWAVFGPAITSFTQKLFA